MSSGLRRVERMGEGRMSAMFTPARIALLGQPVGPERPGDAGEAGRVAARGVAAAAIRSTISVLTLPACCAYAY